MASSDEEDSNLTSSEDEMSTPETTGPSGQESRPSARVSLPKKRKKYIQGFRNEWLHHRSFKSWLKPPAQGSNKPSCSMCKTTVPCAKSGLERHAKCAMHVRNVSAVNAQMPIKQILQTGINYSADTESRICAFIAEHNLPFSISNSLLQLTKAVCPKDTREKSELETLKMSSTKCTNVIRQGLGFYFSKKLVDKLKHTKFSVIPDETTDVNIDKQLAVCTMHYDEDKNDVATSFFDIVNVKKCDAESLYDALKKSFIDKNIPLDNIIGYSSDTCNVMFGEHKSVTSLMKVDLPHVVFVRCSCHSIHLCVSHACLKLSNSLEDTCRNIYAYFSRSSLRRQELKEFQEFVNVSPHKLLSYGQTRWLSLGACVERLLEQWDALRLYFTAVVSEKSDPSYITENILNNLNNPFIKAQLEFMQVQLKRTNEFNKIFQSDKPMLHALSSKVDKLLKEILSDFIQLRYVKECDPYTLNIHDENKHVPIAQVYVGIHATETLSNPPLCHDREGIKKFKIACLSFLIELVSQIRSRFKTSHLAFLDFLKPENALNRNPNSLRQVFKAMPFLDGMCSLEMADIEWRQVALEGKFENVQNALEFWQKTFNQDNLNFEKPYPNLSKVVGCALSLPHSNASVERVFSHLRRIKTDLRNSMKGESLVSLLHTKYGLKAMGVPGEKLFVDDELKKLIKNVKSNATDEECKDILMKKYKE